MQFKIIKQTLLLENWGRELLEIVAFNYESWGPSVIRENQNAQEGEPLKNEHSWFSFFPPHLSWIFVGTPV